tara:strand:- start:47 stop:430 length:384 start_codon:yes stop_codon:yes gene_type:complete
MSKCSECGNSPCDCEVKSLSAEQIAQICGIDEGKPQKLDLGSEKPAQREKSKVLIRRTKTLRRKGETVRKMVPEETIPRVVRRFCPICSEEVEPRRRSCQECGYGSGRGLNTYVHSVENLEWIYEED